MLEVVFSHSAEGSLRCAQHCGNQSGVEVRVPIRSGPSRGGEQPVQMPVPPIEQENEACPLEGTGRDIFCFPLGLSMGDISGDACSQQRKDSAAANIALDPTELSRDLKDIDRSAENFGALVKRAERGESIRIWYSDQPDEMCGMLWLLSELKERVQHLPTILRLKLPAVYQVGPAIMSSSGWGDVDSEYLYDLAPFAQKVTPEYLSYANFEWKRLQREQMPLRVVLNGCVQSVPANFYDSFLVQVLDSMPDEFSEAQLIGKVMGKYQLKIGDRLLAQRVEKLIAVGRVALVTEPALGENIYRRKLKKQAKGCDFSPIIDIL